MNPYAKQRDETFIHVVCADGEAKYWLGPDIELAKNYRLSPRQLREVEQLIEGHFDEIGSAWKKHFGG